MFSGGTYLRRLWRQKPKQWGPASLLGRAVNEYFENKLGSPAPEFFIPFFGNCFSLCSNGLVFPDYTYPEYFEMTGNALISSGDSGGRMSWLIPTSDSVDPYTFYAVFEPIALTGDSNYIYSLRRQLVSTGVYYNFKQAASANYRYYIDGIGDDLIDTFSVTPREMHMCVSAKTVNDRYLRMRSYPIEETFDADQTSSHAYSAYDFEYVALYSPNAQKHQLLFGVQHPLSNEQLDLLYENPYESIQPTSFSKYFDFGGTSYSPINKTLTAKFDIHNTASKEGTVKFDIDNILSKDSSFKFDIKNTISKELVAKYDIRGIASKELIAKFDILSNAVSVSKELVAKFDIKNTISKELIAKYDVHNLISKEGIFKFNISNSVSKELVSKFDIRQTASKELIAVYDMGGTVSKEMICVFNIQSSGSGSSVLVIGGNKHSIRINRGVLRIG